MAAVGVAAGVFTLGLAIAGGVSGSTAGLVGVIVRGIPFKACTWLLSITLLGVDVAVLMFRPRPIPAACGVAAEAGAAVLAVG